MAITRPELQLYRPTIVDDTAANGGRITANEIIPSTSQNLFPDAGVTACGPQPSRKPIVAVTPRRQVANVIA